ncbi:Separin [Drechslerella dactyloides]|uniref:separase n=1 Tax=Drechslerella dactyloides TaxID=74499 RepID=A0AAD6NL97_DREDA|nr:Separin [Drechslerella dactyloides]
MALTKAAGPQDAVRKGLSSLDSCTSAIPPLLRDILFPKQDKAVAPPKHARTKSVVSKSKTTDRASSSTALTDEQRARIAVETLNSTLQLLKDATPQPSSSKSSKAGSSKSTIDSVIECGRQAILYLNSREHSGLRPGTRESAHLNFVNRLAQHGKLDIGIEEAISLKERLTSSSSSPETRKKSLHTVFEWAKVPEDQEWLSLAIGTQISALRLAAAKPDVAALQKLPKSLERDTNLYLMIERLYSTSPAKALKQFDTLATIIYTCAKTLSNTREPDAANPTFARASMDLAFTSILYRLRSAKLQGVPPSPGQTGDIWSILSYSISSARTKPIAQTPKEQFQRLSASANPIFAELAGANSTLDKFESKYLTCSVALATFAEEAQCWNDAIRYLKDVDDRLNPKQHQSLVSSCRIRLATSILKSCATGYSPENWTNFLRNGLEVVIQPLSGSKEKLQSLFQDVMQLRRASSNCLASAKNTSQDISRMCVEICFAAVSFSRRCAVAGILDLHATSKERAMIVGSVDHFLVASRKVTRSGDIGSWWEIEDQRLQEILALARLLDNANEDDDTPIPESKQNIFEKVSVFYQQHSNTLRKADEMEKSVQAFRRSISCFDDRPLDELVSGNLATKYEKLGVLYIGLSDFPRAMDSFSTGLAVHISVGDFENITYNFADSQIDDLHNDEERAIARALSQYVRCCLEAQTDLSFWDNEDLHPDVRCLVLLFQIQASLASATPKGIQLAFSSLCQLLGPQSEITIDIRSRAATTLVSMISALPGKEMQHAFQLVTRQRDELFELTKSSPKQSPPDASVFYRCGLLSLSICLAYIADNDQKSDHLIEGLTCWETLLQMCPSPSALYENTVNAELMIEKLRLLADFLDMKGYSMARKQALELLVKLYKMLDYSVDEIVKCNISLGVQYLRLGFSGKSGSILSEADSLIKREGATTATKLEWTLAYTEYLISTGEGNLAKGASCLAAAEQIVGNDPTVLAAAASGAKIHKRVELNRLVSKACYVSSLLALDKGNINNSITLAKRSLKLMQRAWAGLETLAKHKSSSNANGKSESGVLTYSTTIQALNGPFLWPIVRSIYDITVHVATLYLHQGMQREALFYIEEARNVAEGVDSKSLLFHVSSIFGDLLIRLGSLEEGREKIQQATALKEQLLERGKELVSFDCTLGIMYRKHKSWARELDAYNNAEKTLDALMGSNKAARDEDKVFVDITEKIANMQIDPDKKSKAKVVKPSKTKATAKSAKAPVSDPQPASTTTAVNQCAGLVKLRDDVLRLKAVNLAIQQKWDLAQSLLEETASTSLGSRDLVSQKLAIARSSLLQALSAIEEDDEFHTLQETAIVIPSVASVKTVEAAATKPGRRTPKKAPVTIKEEEAVPPSRAAQLLHDARDNVLAVQALAATVCPTTTLNLLSAMLGEVICLLAAITSDAGMAKTIPAINSLELYRSVSLLREKGAIEAEKIESQESDDLRWPSLPRASLEIDTSSILNFQRDYVDIIPATWAAVSISLGESREELFFTRYQAGQIPFMIRVPLVISEEMDIDEEQFGFERGLSTFRDIVERANVSTHLAKDMITKDTRAKWWTERESLDNELHDLLLNIENNWLRGYKGIFGGYKRHADLIARFNASFVKILNQHLPSRNSGNKKKKNSKVVTLDERVVELFLGIGDPNEEDADLEDSIQDLIYLVIDILQFHGEKNAADEVDIDEMIVLITDALESYHKAVRDYDDCTTVDHTVLILDKSVHALPWESLPCLDGRSVSRLPSLASLRERLEMHNFAQENSQAGIYINRSNTGYILNPALDLTNTQKTYEDELKSMTGWQGLIGKTPSEKDFANYLDEKDLFLYFGHGSGSQYIRARAVKKLNKCAVSLLMGCSSGKLTDAGEFEPFGMPVNYLQGGSPAVVVTLWDVTDKDIDRYSSRVFESWGLFREKKEKKGAKGKAKMKVKHDETAAAAVEKPASSLCLAAATSRGACKMRYLNGAAPVVYGVPVYLK